MKIGTGQMPNSRDYRSFLVTVERLQFKPLGENGELVGLTKFVNELFLA